MRVLSHRGEGDLHDDSSYDKYCSVIDLATSDIFGETSTNYILEICPTEKFFDTYRTSNPVIASVGAVCIVFVSTLLFFCYDRIMNSELHAKRELLEAKRNFTRWVSHEVRTPLSSVCMGLALIQTDMEQNIPAVLKSPEESRPSGSKEETKVVAWYGQILEVLENARSSVDVLNKLLHYDKVEMGTIKLELSVVPIWPLVEKTFKEFQLSANNKNLTYVLTFQNIPGDIDEESRIQHARALDFDTLRAISVADAFRLVQVLR